MPISRTTELVFSKHNNMLIIGKAATVTSYKEIVYGDSVESVLEKYGDSPLYQAFKAAKDNGVETVFLLSIEDARDIFDVIGEISQHDFSYIVPLNIALMDYFYDTYNQNRKTYYIEYMLRYMGRWSESVIIATDKHASLFEDQDAFAGYMNNAARTFEYYCTSDLRMDNITFIANHLSKWKNANLALAIALCVTDVSQYPKLDFGEPIFYIDQWDQPYNWGYFVSHADGSITAENLLNFTAAGADKILTIERIVKMIKRELDLSEFEGKLYTEYQRVRILTKLNTYLEQLVGYVLNKFEIDSVTPLKNANHTVTVLTRFTVWPINSLESCTIEKEVHV